MIADDILYVFYGDNIFPREIEFNLKVELSHIQSRLRGKKNFKTVLGVTIREVL